MKISKKKSRFLAYLLISLAVSMFMVAEDYMEGEYSTAFEMIADFCEDLILDFIQVFFLGTIALKLITWMDRSYAWSVSFAKRLFLELLIVASFAILATVINYWVGIYIEKEEIIDKGGFLLYLLPAFLIYFLAISFIFVLHELINSLTEQEALTVQSEVLLRKNVEAEYEALKNQINPHFLFNSFSVLSSLVYKDPDKADEFINEFSKVFRYVLELNNQTVVNLKRELNFLDSYLYLLKIRFGDNINFDKRIEVEKLPLLLPPLATQLIIENAVKHNKVDKEHQLKIELLNEGDYLIIRNSVNIRKDNANSTGQGLKNLKEKYSLISDLQPEFSITNDYYIAKLPLLANEVD